MLQTVIETPEYIRRASKCMDEESRESFITYIAANPLDGELITETGGARKTRWVSNRRGKRGGARIIYYYYNENMPIFLFTAYGKNEKSDISNNEKKMLKKIIKFIVKNYYEDNDHEQTRKKHIKRR